MSLRPGALERIGLLSAGRVSFHQPPDRPSASGDSGYPRRIFEGEPLSFAGKEIPYLRFVPCPMSRFHAKTLEAFSRAAGEAPEAPEARLAPEAPEARLAVPIQAQTLYDMVFPNPELPPQAALDPPPGAEGLYLSHSTQKSLAEAPESWKTSAGVRLEKLSGGVPLISGAFLRLENSGPKKPPALESYSAKYARLGRDVLEILSNGPGKILVYHHRVRMSGILLTQALLEENGFVGENAPVTPTTRCAICGTPKSKHTAAAAARTWAKAHDFRPARYLVVHSEVDRATIERRIVKFNAWSNRDGGEFRVLAGSKIIREGFDLKAVRYELIASLPTDISTLIQVFGRAVRRGSHAALPQGEREVRIRIYVSVGAGGGPGGGQSLELARYAEKMEDYLLIQKVEGAIRRHAIDSAAAAPPPRATIDGLPYRPLLSRGELQRLPQSTESFTARGYGEKEVRTLSEAILALFETRPVWTYEDLWAAVREPGRVKNLAVDPASFSEESYALALDATAASGKRAYPGGARTKVCRVGRYYVRAFLRPDGRPVLDVESYVRPEGSAQDIKVDVTSYVESSQAQKNFATRFGAFLAEYGGGKDIREILLAYDAGFHYALLRGLVAKSLPDSDAKGAERTLARAAALYRRYKVLVSGSDVARAPKAKAFARNPPKGAELCGYVALESVKMYDAATGWYDVPRQAFNLGDRYRENSTVVGYMERKGARLRFKVRPPLQDISRELAASATPDVRLVSRGAVCETRARAEQESLAQKLRAAPASQLARMSSGQLCEAISSALLGREEAARASAKGMASGLRWFYLFNERLPPIT